MDKIFDACVAMHWGWLKNFDNLFFFAYLINFNERIKCINEERFKKRLNKK